MVLGGVFPVRWDSERCGSAAAGAGRGPSCEVGAAVPAKSTVTCDPPCWKPRLAAPAHSQRVDTHSRKAIVYRLMAANPRADATFLKRPLSGRSVAPLVARALGRLRDQRFCALLPLLPSAGWLRFIRHWPGHDAWLGIGLGLRLVGLVTLLRGRLPRSAPPPAALHSAAARIATVSNFFMRSPRGMAWMFRPDGPPAFRFQRLPFYPLPAPRLNRRRAKSPSRPHTCVAPRFRR